MHICFDYHHPPINSHRLPIEFRQFSRLPNASGPTIHHPIGFPSNSTRFPPFPPTIPSVWACHSHPYPTPLGLTPNPSAHLPGLPTHPLFNSIWAWHSPHPSTNSIWTLSTHLLGLRALIRTSICLPIGLPTHPPFNSDLSGSQLHICTPFLLSGPGAHPCHHVRPSICPSAVGGISVHCKTHLQVPDSRV